MAIWPFGRSKKVKRATPNADTALQGEEREILAEKPLAAAPLPVTGHDIINAEPPKAPSVDAAQTDKENKHQTRNRSKTPSRVRPDLESEGITFGVTTTVTAGTPLSPLASNPVKPKLKSHKSGTSPGRWRRTNREAEGGAASRSATVRSRASLDDDEDITAIPVIPTLTHYTKIQSSESKSRRSRSSKRKDRKVDERLRSEEFRSTSGSSSIPIPKRPASDAGGIMVRETRPAPNLKKRPNSEISLPLPETLYDSVLATGESTSYKVSVFDILSPRPTIKYNSHPRYLTSSHGRNKEPVLPDADGDWTARARMNELADDLDAHGLRELMDRDRRRRERKRKVDADNLARKLERKAEKEKKGKSKRKKDKGKRKEKERGRSTNKEGKAPPAATVAATSAPAAETGRPDENPQDDPFATTANYYRVSRLSYSLRGSPTSPASPVSPLSPTTPLDDPFQDRSTSGDAAIQPLGNVQRQASASSPIASTAPEQVKESAISELKQKATSDSLNASSLPSGSQSEKRRDSGIGGRKGGWAMLFRRSQRKTASPSQKDSATPSESAFSNASNESFARTGPSAVAESTFTRVGGIGGPEPPVTQMSFKRSGPPQRTMSKFREDLPDVARIGQLSSPTENETPPAVPPKDTPQPKSPPQSRVASPEPGSGPPSPFVDDPGMLSTAVAMNAQMEDVHPALRGDVVALSRGPSTRSHKEPPAGANAALLSQSLASVDSEGSWLSGRPSKRSSIVTARPSSTSIGGGNGDTDTRESVTGSPIIFGRRTSNYGPTGGGVVASGNITDQIRNLGQSGSNKDTASGLESSITPDSSNAPTPVHLSTLVAEEVVTPTEGDQAVLHTATVARSPTLVNRRSAAHRSREGLLDIFDPEPSSAVVESTVQEPHTTQGDPTRRRSSSDASPVSPGEVEGEKAEIKRATSVKLKGDRGHARQVSAGSAKLLDLSRRTSRESSRFSEGRRGSAVSLQKPIDLTTGGEEETKTLPRTSRLSQTISASDFKPPLADRSQTRVEDSPQGE